MSLSFKTLLTIALGQIFSFTAFAQDATSFLSHAISSFEKQPPTEKVYLHIDRSVYGFGDTIWYKAYAVIGHHHQLSALSGVLYVELIGTADTVITRQILPLKYGVAWSEIPLSPTLKQGDYRIRAYTRWMQNAGTEYFYNHKIRIGGAVLNNIEEKRAVQKPDVQFFPEGGDLVNGLRSRIAIKVVNYKGAGEDVKGTIEDDEGNVITDFATQHLGMGVFAITPQIGKNYKAMIRVNGEAVYAIDLPKVKDEGVTLALNNSASDSIYVKVAANAKLLKAQQNSLFYLIGQSAGKVYYATQGTLNEPVFAAGVEKKRFPSGIVQFTLFGSDGEPLAERIAFIQNKDSLDLKINLGAKKFTTRQPIKIILDSRYDAQPVAGAFSVAITNESTTDGALESTIFDNLLLTSDLKGSIENPGYYFNNVNNQTRADLDVLMLTQGYRRFEWRQLLNDQAQTVAYQPETSLELEGKVQALSGKPVSNGKVTITATKDNFFEDTVTDINGNFKFTDLELSDSSKIILNARKDNKSKNVKITVLPPHYAEILKTAHTDTAFTLFPEQMTGVMQKRYLDYQRAQKDEQFRNGIRLKQVNIKGYRQPRPPEIIHSANLNGPGHADQIIMGNQLSNCASLSDCLLGKVLGVKFAKDGTPVSSRSHGPQMVIIVDGNLMDGKLLNDVNANDIYSIEVLRSGAYLAIYGSDASGGALVITMKHGGEPGSEPTNFFFAGVSSFPFKGYYHARAFYSPKYAAIKNVAQSPDLRGTIYWNPNILTDKDGKATFEYFNNDTKGIYRVAIEGIDDNGNLGRLVYKYKVE